MTEKFRSDLYECKCGSRLFYTRPIYSIKKDKSINKQENLHIICCVCNRIVRKDD